MMTKLLAVIDFLRKKTEGAIDIVVVMHFFFYPESFLLSFLCKVLQILTQETTPTSDLIATVKHLYETKLKDVSILIPMLSSLSKNEVCVIRTFVAHR
ncbi:hypothetical protein G4B88_007893 [Cannabis sativa]|uniref:Uncharacterized protein n=1 Tax=Cannabis sativa TaxID=3483 RepID=A0A7J6EJQ7_CANSA|nr:hypothetical protein G4B88_007893 [Cannabis sativa]